MKDLNKINKDNKNKLIAFIFINIFTTNIFCNF